MVTRAIPNSIREGYLAALHCLAAREALYRPFSMYIIYKYIDLYIYPQRGRLECNCIISRAMSGIAWQDLPFHK